jgi:MoaA/NifB/PqqE/SkfB family radical SAM enzyme
LKKYFVIDTDKVKIIKSRDYNYTFNKKNGYFQRWGINLHDDPVFSPIGPEILDVEISEICKRGCPICYKDNKAIGRNMSLEQIKMILLKVKNSICQVAYGIGDISGNPELFDILKYTREIGIIPNITINGRITEEQANELLKYIGACAVSHYDSDECYNAVKMLSDKGLKQTNIHYFLAQQTYDKAFEVLKDIKNDSRLSNLNAIVFLSLKKKGRAVKNNYTSVTNEQFKALVDYCLQNKINFGFDSCSAVKFDNSIVGLENEEQLLQASERCESSLFSAYINVEGKYSPCSFCEGCTNWEDGLQITPETDFNKDIWFNKKTIEFRDNLLKRNRQCPIYEI